MHPLLRLKTYYLIFFFYRIILLVSSIIAIILFYARAPFSSVMGFKLLMLGLIFIILQETKYRQELTFYQNFGISKTMLFLISFIFDVITTLIIYLTFFLFDS
ncbi:hypothetical protein AAY42_17415 [Flagellimonas eckloniae]|uniref:Uncharacterized protein n=1 Tax=Flagellimonas eckloniae TaxID=346185 RepID=A0A0Q1HDD9_9FLAO|nr:hypothetical protein AAY42_17415 [Allomuricauda eckloniae]